MLPTGGNCISLIQIVLLPMKVKKDNRTKSLLTLEASNSEINSYRDIIIIFPENRDISAVA